MMLFAWTDERISALRKMFADGCSASIIADQLGCRTRNAVIGKLHRLGLKRGHSVATQRVPPRGKNSRPRLRRHIPPGLNPFMVDEPAIKLDPVEIPIEQRRTLLELRNEHCRFPYLEGEELFFCGAPGADFIAGCPYCPRHDAIAYRGKS